MANRKVKRAIKLSVSTGFWLGHSFVGLCKRALGMKRPGTLVLLYYHALDPKDVPRFRAQMKRLTELAKPVHLDSIDALEGGGHHVAVTFDDGYQSFLLNALPELVRYKIPATVFVTAGCLGSYPAWPADPWEPNPAEPVMTEEQLRGLPTGIIRLGSHTMTHPDLSLLSEPRLFMELFESKQRLETIVGQDVKYLSLPYGKGNQDVVKAARQCGYRRVFSSIVPIVVSADRTRYVIARIKVSSSDSPLEFQLKILGAYQWLELLHRVRQKAISVNRLFNKVHAQVGRGDGHCPASESDTQSGAIQ